MRSLWFIFSLLNALCLCEKVDLMAGRLRCDPTDNVLTVNQTIVIHCSLSVPRKLFQDAGHPAPKTTWLYNNSLIYQEWADSITMYGAINDDTVDFNIHTRKFNGSIYTVESFLLGTIKDGWRPKFVKEFTLECSFVCTFTHNRTRIFAQSKLIRIIMHPSESSAQKPRCPPTGCLSNKVKTLKRVISNMTTSSRVKYIKQISNTSTMTSGDIGVISDVVTGITKLLQSPAKRPKTEKQRRAVMKNIVQTTSNILSQRNAWEQINSSKARLEYVNRFTNSIENICLKMAENQTRDFEVSNSQIDLKSMSVEQDKADVNFDSGDYISLQLKPSKHEKFSDSSPSPAPQVVFVRYKGIGDYFSSKKIGVNKSRELNNTKVVLSDIVSATSTDADRISKLRFRLTYQSSLNMTGGLLRCAYWNTSNLTWLYDGCRALESKDQDSSTICECDHLTNFAVIMDFMGVTKTHSSKHKIALEVITYLGCVISILFCLYAGVAYEFARRTTAGQSLRESLMTNIIYEMIFFSICFAQFIFVIGIHQTQLPIFCAIVAALLQYLLLLQFEWMMVAGVFYFLVFVSPYNLSIMEARRKWILGILFAIPALIVIISASIGHEGFGTDEHCWLSTENGLIWAFVGPVTLFITINIILLFSLIFLTETKASSSGHESFADVDSNQGWVVSRRRQYRYELLYAITLGITWVFGYFHFNYETSIAFSYIFVILNSLQGVFICIFYGNWQRMSDAYVRYLSRSLWLPQGLRAWIGRYDRRMSRSSFTRERNSDSGLARQSRMSYLPDYTRDSVQLRSYSSGGEFEDRLSEIPFIDEKSPNVQRREVIPE